MIIKILRIVEKNKLISADTFEENFKKFSSQKFQIDYLSAEEFNNCIIKCYKKNIPLPVFFNEYNYLSFGFGAFLAIPLFLKIRNQFRLKTKLLFISHAPGSHILEFYFMQKLLKSGDVIIAPTMSASETIKYLSPAIYSFVKTIYHPVEFQFNNFRKGHEKFFLSLTRIHPDKLLHKIIDAIYLLKEKGINVKLLIAGKLTNDNNVLTTYAKILFEKVKFLQLESNVKFLGEISSVKEKISYLSNAVALINLSVTVEESFGKSIVESICATTPVIVTKWDGFIETAGKCGIYIPVKIKNGFADVDSDKIACAMENILKNNKKFKKNCLIHSKKFRIKNAGEKYYKVLLKNFTKTKKREKGLIDKLSVVKVFSFNEIFELYINYFEKNIVEKSNTITDGAIFHQILNLSVTKSLRYFLKGSKFKDRVFKINKNSNILKKNFYYSLVNSVFLESTEYSKELSLFFSLGKVDVDYYESILNKIDKFIKNKRNINYLKVEIEILKGNYNKAEKLWKRFFSRKKFKENDFILIRQIAKIYRKLKLPEKSIPIIKTWLEKYNFSINSLQVWTDLCFNSIEADGKFINEAKNALKMVKTFSEDKEFVNKLEKKFIERLI